MTETDTTEIEIEFDSSLRPHRGARTHADNGEGAMASAPFDERKRAVLHIIARKHYDQGVSWVGAAYLSRALGCPPQQMGAALTALKDDGVIVQRERRGTRGGAQWRLRGIDLPEGVAR